MLQSEDPTDLKKVDKKLEDVYRVHKLSLQVEVRLFAVGEDMWRPHSEVFGATVVVAEPILSVSTHVRRRLRRVVFCDGCARAHRVDVSVTHPPPTAGLHVHAQGRTCFILCLWAS